MTRRLRPAAPPLADAPASVTASEAKNSFGRVLDRVAREGRVAITKHDEPCAVLVSIDEYRALVASGDLDTLCGEFDALFDRLQVAGAASAMEQAFAMVPADLANAALAEAAPVPRRAAAARRARRVRG